MIVDETNKIARRIVRQQEKHARYQEFVVPIQCLQTLSCFWCVPKINEGLPRGFVEKEGIRKAAEGFF